MKVSILHYASAAVSLLVQRAESVSARNELPAEDPNPEPTTAHDGIQDLLRAHGMGSDAMPTQTASSHMEDRHPMYGGGSTPSEAEGAEMHLRTGARQLLTLRAAAKCTP